MRRPRYVCHVCRNSAPAQPEHVTSVACRGPRNNHAPVPMTLKAEGATR